MIGVGAFRIHHPSCPSRHGVARCTCVDAARLVALYDERIALAKAMANHPSPTGAMAQAVLDKGAELDAACEAFRRRYYPRKHRVLVGLRSVMAASRHGRSITTIYDAEAAS